MPKKLRFQWSSKFNFQSSHNKCYILTKNQDNNKGNSKNIGIKSGRLFIAVVNGLENDLNTNVCIGKERRLLALSIGRWINKTDISELSQTVL